jgi:hypothetical protein
MLAKHPRFEQLRAAVESLQCGCEPERFITCGVYASRYDLGSMVVSTRCYKRIDLPRASFLECLELIDIVHPCCNGEYTVSLCCLGLFPNMGESRFNIVPICAGCRELCAMNRSVLCCIYRDLTSMLPRELAGLILSILMRLPMHDSLTK